MRGRTLFALVAALALLFAAMPRDAHADEGWTIERFAAQIAIQRDGSLLITESIDVDFGALVKHGIFREIPIEYAIPGDDKHNRIYGFEAVSVTDAAGKPWAYTQSRVGANVQLKIGDADRTVSGAQSYRITYRVTDTLNAFPDHDELYWNVNGPDWPVRTKAATAAVTLEGGGIERTACFEGPAGSTRRLHGGRRRRNGALQLDATVRDRRADDDRGGDPQRRGDGAGRAAHRQAEERIRTVLRVHAADDHRRRHCIPARTDVLRVQLVAERPRPHVHDDLLPDERPHAGNAAAAAPRSGRRGVHAARRPAPGADGRAAGRARRHEGRHRDDRRPGSARLPDDRGAGQELGLRQEGLEAHQEEGRRRAAAVRADDPARPVREGR